MKMYIRSLLVLVILILAACGQNAGTTTLTLQETAANVTEVTQETIYMNNCGGKGDVKQTAARSKNVTVDFGGTVGFKTEILAKSEVSAKYSQSNISGKTIELVAPPRTNMEFIVEWTENAWLGVVRSQETDETGDYKVSVPISVALISSRDLGNCDPMATQETLPPSPVGTSGEMSTIIYADINDAEIGTINCSDWSDCWNNTNGNYLVNNDLVGSVASELLSSGYNIKRVFLLFDTSSIPNEGVINKAVLHFHTGVFQNGNTTVHIVKSIANNPISRSDFGAMESLSGGSVSPAASTWSSIQFSQEALSWINRGSISKFFFVHENDIHNNEPTLDNNGNFITISLAEDFQYRPYIELFFEVP